MSAVVVNIRSASARANESYNLYKASPNMYYKA